MARALFLLVLYFFGLTATDLSFAQMRSSPAEAKTVIVTPLVREALQRRIETVGRTEAIKSVMLYPAAADEVVAVNIVPGQRVNAGTVLVQLDDRRQQTAFKRAQIQLADAERTFARLTESQRKGAIPKSELDVAELNLALARVALEDARSDLDDRRVLAPFTGVVGITDIEVGDRVNEQTLVTTLDDTTELLIDFGIPEDSIGSVTAQQTIAILPWDSPSIAYTAKVTQFDSRINATDRTLRARALLDNRVSNIRPGASFKVVIEAQGEVTVAIPESALLWGATGAYVWCVNEGKAIRRDVKVRQRLRGRILIEGDFAAQDSIIVEGTQRLRNGQAVKAIPQEASVL